MSYKVGGVEFTLQPTAGKWVERNLQGRSGSGHPIYSGVREFELQFQLSAPSDFNQLQAWFNAVGSTGTVVVDLPKYGDSTYGFYSYSGCVINEPVSQDYFAEYQQNVTLLISNIRT
jgi:hypothetical protein